MKWMKISKARRLLPWYAGGQLSPDERQFVETCLAENPTLQDELAFVQQLRVAMVEQPMASPSAALQMRLHQTIAAQPRPAPSQAFYPRLLASFLLAVATLIFLWVTIKPGIMLAWQANSEDLVVYRVYRAPLNSSEYTLIEEVQARPGVTQYRYTDVFLLPGQIYSYMVEGVKQNGHNFLSDTITAPSSQALPLQLSLLFLSIAMGYWLSALSQNWRRRQAALTTHQT